jgi:hypothetical protein
LLAEWQVLSQQVQFLNGMLHFGNLLLIPLIGSLVRFGQPYTPHGLFFLPNLVSVGFSRTNYSTKDIFRAVIIEFLLELFIFLLQADWMGIAGNCLFMAFHRYNDSSFLPFRSGSRLYKYSLYTMG